MPKWWVVRIRSTLCACLLSDWIEQISDICYCNICMFVIRTLEEGRRTLRHTKRVGCTRRNSRNLPPWTTAPFPPPWASSRTPQHRYCLCINGQCTQSDTEFWLTKGWLIALRNAPRSIAKSQMGLVTWYRAQPLDVDWMWVTYSLAPHLGADWQWLTLIMQYHLMCVLLQGRTGFAMEIVTQIVEFVAKSVSFV